ncbi:N-acetylglucosamine-6-phosphate deacetylase [Lactobacillus plantarum JDM1] [Lactiplantibacillus mudanjiangensis]|uniref:N-acetylglucosamine-6-phosphate deacetylase n=1 Tax=Lactiplantibacillus mudanjiangensis TaxID=1296538 RepID=UPI0010154AD0|nr:N-acetylglucosamine-6-phosphate deacetylase [Lactiplantibacillus mudanjiangensis]VDG18077.1 N-acetylglucosamine-6-phosphate deacetylase [Lactobacillus plantarum JDM1] [Lactiplantibacillus mudanjiangensis]VDG31348.1 N-acetylglucosamine-6-phosphate deacetylase [Lactobacillus plantarum JDM1] [Lactiplantibacillus mudanjiangensis]
MSKVLKHAIIYTGLEKIDDGYIRFGKEIEAVGPMDEYVAQPDDDIEFVSGKTIVPGFIDVHSHGGYSFDSMDGNPAEINEMVNDMVAREGITSYFCTTMTQSNENLDHSMKGINEAAKENPVIQGVHLEGPFISATFKGAQPEKYIKNPNVELLDNWNKLSGGRVKLITYAPEDPGSREFEKYCLENGIVPSVGHSNATREQLLASKATHVTHLYNAQREFKHREPGVTGHAMLENNMYCELICDGFHIVPDMINLAYEQKGADRLELVTDSMRAKGEPDGISELGGQKVIVKDGQARLEEGNLAGSVLTYINAFKNVQKFTGCGIFEAVKMSSVNQANEFGLTRKGTLEAGKDADINVLDADQDLVATYSYGKLATK